MFKNTASQKLAVFAWNAATGSAKTGDAANITAQISKDGGASAATNDTNPTELDATNHPGIYVFDLTQAETNADLVILSAASSTADIEIKPVVIYTTPTSVAVSDKTGFSLSTAGNAAVIDEFETQSQADPTGFHVNVIEVGGTAQTANDNGADINAILADTNELQTDWTNGGRLDLIADSILEDTGTTIPGTITIMQGNVTDILTDTNELQIVEGAYTLQDCMKIILSFVAGKTSGGGTTSITFRDTGDSADRIVMTVDESGNRSVVALSV